MARKRNTDPPKPNKPKRNLTPKKRISGDWVPAFLAHFGEWANVRSACAAAGVSRPTAYERREKDEEFGAAWEDAKQSAVEKLEQRARERAMECSDTLMIFLLKSHNPEVYRERRAYEVTGAEGGPVEVDVGGVRERLAGKLASIAARQRAGSDTSVV